MPIADGRTPAAESWWPSRETGAAVPPGGSPERKSSAIAAVTAATPVIGFVQLIAPLPCPHSSFGAHERTGPDPLPCDPMGIRLGLLLVEFVHERNGCHVSSPGRKARDLAREAGGQSSPSARGSVVKSKITPRWIGRSGGHGAFIT